MRRLAVIIALVGTACGPSSEGDFGDGQRWLQQAPFRRQVLEDSLVSWSNGYARLRLQHYGEDGWGARTAWRPEVASVQTGTTTPGAFGPSVLDLADSEDNWRAQGEHAFFHYPVQVVPELRAALTDPASCGLEVTEAGLVEGIVWVQLPDGPQPALTCAACHAGGAGAGRANAAFDLGAVLSSSCDQPSSWGPGRVDVTPDGVDNPTAIPDLRPVARQRYLHRAGTVENGRLALAARTETLIITSLSSLVRAPRQVALGLAWWMWSLDEALAEPPPDREAEALYATHCGACHSGAGRVGGLVPLEQVATDLSVLDSPDRRTGFARVPSLRGLSDRGQLFSGGAAPSLQAWWSGEAVAPGHFDPARLSAEAHGVLGSYLQTF